MCVRALQEHIKEIIKKKLSEGQDLTLTVCSLSMWPLLKRGDVIKVKSSSANDYKSGQVVVFFSGKEFIVHRLRVINFNTDTFITCADNNLHDDAPQRVSSILGEVYAVIRDGKTISFQSVLGRLYQMSSPFVGRVFIYLRLVRPKFVDWAVMHNSNIFFRYLTRSGYYFCEWLLEKFVKQSRSQGFITRSMAVDDIVAGRTDVDSIIVTKTNLEASKIGKFFQKLSFFFPVISDPTVVPVKSFYFWMQYGGALRLEALSWQTLADPLEISIQMEGTHYDLSLLLGGVEIYKKTWDHVFKLSMPKELYHAKNISNFQKYCIDAVRWIRILEGAIAIDSFKLKRRDVLIDSKALFQVDDIGKTLYTFLLGEPKMDSKSRSHVLIEYFLWIASKLETALLKYAKEKGIHFDLPHTKDPAVEPNLAIYETLEAQLLYAQMVDDRGSLYPVTESLAQLCVLLYPFSQIQNRSKAKDDAVQAALLRKDIAEIAIYLGYYAGHLEQSRLQAMAVQAIRLLVFAKYQSLETDPQICAHMVMSEYPIAARLILTSPSRSLSVSERQCAFIEVSKILEELIDEQ